MNFVSQPILHVAQESAELADRARNLVEFFVCCGCLQRIGDPHWPAELILAASEAPQLGGIRRDPPRKRKSPGWGEPGFISWKSAGLSCRY
jgi:hypothetical protein